MSERDVPIPGLDGATALGFLAGLGLLRVLADAADRHPPALSWRLLDAWRPVLHGPASLDDVVDAVERDTKRWANSAVLTFQYVKVEKKKNKKTGAEEREPKLFSGLRAPVAVLRSWLDELKAKGDGPALEYTAALMCETATEPIDRPPTSEELASAAIQAAADAPLDRVTMPTFFDFTSRNAQFLDQVEHIRRSIDRGAIDAQLRHGRGSAEAARSMDWDPGADTPAAIYTGHVRSFFPVAEWLAFRGLVFFPLAGFGSTLRTTSCSGRRKDGEFVWPLWGVKAGAATVGSLLGLKGIDKLDAGARRALGVTAVFRSGLTKMADGYAGMFAPSRPT